MEMTDNGDNNVWNEYDVIVSTSYWKKIKIMYGENRYMYYTLIESHHRYELAFWGYTNEVP